MRNLLAILAAASILGSAVPSHAAEPMRRMNLLESKSVTPEQRPLFEAWQKTFRPENPAGALYQAYKVGNRTVTLVIAQQDSCDGGAMTPTSTQTWETCPVNVISQGPEGTKTQTLDGGCFLAPNRTLSPSAPDPQTNYTATTYDPVTKVILVKTYQNGVEIPECTKSLAVQ